MTNHFPMEKLFQRVLNIEKGNLFTLQTLKTANIQYKLLLKSLECFPKKQHRALSRLVFPILSMYQSLKILRLSTEESLALVEMVLRGKFSTQVKGIRLLNDLLRNPFPVIRPVLQMMVKFSDLPNGQEIVQNDKDCFAINVHQCFIYDAMKKSNTPELTPVFCATDDWLSAEMPKISWQRTQTLGRGDELCDFCWCRNQPTLR